MDRRWRGGGKSGLAALLACGLLAFPSHASDQPVSIGQLNALRTALAEHASRLEAEDRFVGGRVTDVLMRAGMAPLAEQVHREVAAAGMALPMQAIPRITAEAPASAEIINLRLALAVLSQTYGFKDDYDVLMAQGARPPEAVSFRHGVVTLADIDREIQALGITDRPMAQGGVLRRPVVLWEDTILRLGPGEHLAMSRPEGAFVISFGRVEITGSHVTVAGGENPHSPDFVPFLTVGGGGALEMSGATVSGLGFGQTEKFSGVGVVAHPLMRRVGTSVIDTTIFDGLQSLTLAGVSGARVIANRFHDMQRVGLAIGASPATFVHANTFDGGARTNSIRVFRGSSDASVLGNLMIGGERLGILVERGSDRAHVSGNLIWERDGGAIKFDRISCGVAASNIVLDSDQKGIQVRASDETMVRENLIVGNGSAGLWVSAQDDAARTFFIDNLVQGNRVGLSTATGADIVLTENDFTGQSPRLFDGDVAHLTLALLGELHRAEPVLLSRAGPEALAEIPAVACDDAEGF